MALSEAKQRANDKYSREHMASLSCKVRKEVATAFREYCNSQGKSVHAELKEYVMEKLKSNGIEVAYTYKNIE